MRPLTRQSRSPVTLGLMVFIFLVCMWQVITGPDRYEMSWILPKDTYVPLALINVIGTMLALLSTILADAWTAAAFEVAGCLIVCGPTVIYLWSVLTTSRYPDTHLITALLLGLLSGLLWRVGSILVDVVSVVREKSAPPVGDLDLVTAERVNAVSELVAASHGGMIGREAAELDRTLPREGGRHSQ